MPDATMDDAGEAGTPGDDSGVEAGGYVDAGGYNPEICSSACMTATGCPTQSCYAASANPVAMPAVAGVAETLLYPTYAHDSNLATRYSTGAPAVGMEWFQVDLCRSVTVSGVTLDDTTDPTDQAAAYTVQVSLDGSTWTDVATSAPISDAGSESGAGDAGVDAGVSALPAVLTITFPPVSARYVRFNQTGTLPTSARTGAPHWWSIDEFTVACPAVMSDGGDGGATDAAMSDSASE
jgi:hypothetical protein